MDYFEFRKEILNLTESPIGDKLMKSAGSGGDYPDLGIVNYNPMKFHTVGKPVVAQGINYDGDNEDYIFYSDGKYVMGVAGHKEVEDGGSSDNAMISMVDSTGTMNPAELKKFATKEAKENMKKVLKITNKVRDFSKAPEGQDMAPKQIKREPFRG